MSLWLIRAGGHGQYEQRFLDESRVYLTWDDFNVDLSKLPDVHALRAALAKREPESVAGKIINHASQIWPFAKEMKPGDWFVTPSKLAPTVHADGSRRRDRRPVRA